MPLPPCANPQKGAERHCGACHYCLVRVFGDDYWCYGAMKVEITVPPMDVVVNLDFAPRFPTVMAVDPTTWVIDRAPAIAAIWRAAYRERR